jgi:hypothetical protein
MAELPKGKYPDGGFGLFLLARQREERSMKKLLILSVAAVVVGLPGFQITFGFEAMYTGLHPGSVAVNKTGPMAKAGTSLFKAFAEYRAHMRQGPTTPFRPSNPFLQYARGRVVIDAVATDDAGALLSDLHGLGLQQATRFGAFVSGWFPLAALDRAVKLESLRFVAASLRPQLHAGAVTSLGDQALRADVARGTYGVDGGGVTVGVLSDSYDQKNGAAADVSSGDLPAGVIVLDDSANCGGFFPQPCTDEGRAMMQIVHDVAPGAGLAFHTAFNGMAGFANGILDLANVAGARVIVDDVMYFAEPMFQNGIVAQAVDQVVGGGSAYFSAAGNQARDSYEVPFAPSGESFYVQGFFGNEYRGELHDFDPGPGVDWLQQISIPVGGIVVVAFQWDSPFGSLQQNDGSPNDLDIYLVDDSGGFILAESIADNISGGDPVEVLQFVNDGSFGTRFNLMLAHFAGPQAGLMKYVHFGHAAIEEYATDSGTIYGHANAAGAEAVGAAFYGDTPEFGVSPALLEYYSSAGGTPILFDSAGNRLSASELREKPQIVAPDGGNTTFFYADSSADEDDWPNFFGTSAAAPHAAGVAALMRQAVPAAPPEVIYSSIETTALDMGSAGFDFESGHGLVQADAAVAAVSDGAVPPPGGEPPAAFFTYACSGLSCAFDGSGSSYDAGTVTFEWNFGDGTGATDAVASHSYAGTGTYAVHLTVLDTYGSGGADVSFRVKNKGASSGSSNDGTSGGGTGDSPPCKGKNKNDPGCAN